MIKLSDHQLQTVMLAATGIPVEKRAQFLERIAAMLPMPCSARRGMTQSSAPD